MSGSTRIYVRLQTRSLVVVALGPNRDAKHTTKTEKSEKRDFWMYETRHHSRKKYCRARGRSLNTHFLRRILESDENFYLDAPFEREKTYQDTTPDFGPVPGSPSIIIFKEYITLQQQPSHKVGLTYHTLDSVATLQR